MEHLTRYLVRTHCRPRTQRQPPQREQPLIVGSWGITGGQRPPGFVLASPGAGSQFTRALSAFCMCSREQV